MSGGNTPKDPNDNNSLPSSQPYMRFIGSVTGFTDLVHIASDMQKAFTEQSRARRQSVADSAAKKASQAASVVRGGAVAATSKMAEGVKGAKRRLSEGFGMAAARLSSKKTPNSTAANYEEEEEEHHHHTPEPSAQKVGQTPDEFVHTVIEFLLATIKTNVIELGSASAAFVQANNYIRDNMESDPESETLGLDDESKKIGIRELCAILDQVEYVPEGSDEGFEHYLDAIRRSFVEDAPALSAEFLDLVIHATFLTDVKTKSGEIPFEEREAFRDKQIRTILIQNILASDDNLTDTEINALAHSTTQLRQEVLNNIGNLFAEFNQTSRADANDVLEYIAESIEHLSVEQNNNIMMLSKAVLMLLKSELESHELNADLTDERVQKLLMQVISSRPIQQKISEFAASVITAQRSFIEEQAQPVVNFARNQYPGEFWVTILEKIEAHLKDPSKFITDTEEKTAAKAYWGKDTQDNPNVADLLARIDDLKSEYTNTKNNPTASKQLLSLSELIDKLNPNWKGQPTDMEDGSEDYLEPDPTYVDLKVLLMQMAERFNGDVKHIDLGKKPFGGAHNFQQMVLDFVHDVTKYTPPDKHHRKSVL